MATLIIYGIMAAAAIGGAFYAWTGFKEHIAAPYIQEQIKADQKIVDKANKAQTDAETERDHARSDTQACVVKADAQSKEVDRWKGAADAAEARSKAAKAAAMKEATAAAPRIADLQAKAAAAPKLMACQDELDRAKAVLRDQLRQKRGIQSAPVEAPPVLVK